jgi:hypothetical protein
MINPDSLDEQINLLEKTITSSTPSSSSESSNSFSISNNSDNKNSSKWKLTIKIGISALLSLILLAGFRPIWIYNISYNKDDEEDNIKKEILWVRAGGAWLVMTLIFFLIYHFILSRYI